MADNRVRRIINERILLLDGAFGTMVQHHLDEAGFRGVRFKGWLAEVKGCNDLLVLTQPDIVRGIHEAYLKAGADIITTDSFNANAISLGDYHLEEYVYEIASTAARIAREAADKYSTEDKPRFVAGSVGPTSKSLSIATDVEHPESRDITFDELKATYHEQIRGLVDGGADIILIETAFDTLNVKAALCAASEVFRESRKELPIMVSATIADISGRMLAGQTIEAFYSSIASYDLLSVGFNCGFGPDQYLPFVERLSAISEIPVSVHPNAGLPNVEGGYDETPQSFCTKAEEFLRKGLINIIGGCCGTTPEHISALGRLIEGYQPRPAAGKSCITRISGLEELRITPELNFINIGERTNVAGSAKFKRLISEGNYEEALSVARTQVDNGAQVIDVCMDDGMINGPEAMGTFLRLVASEPEISRVPVMVDSSSWETIEAGLKAVQGKCIVNSISLKEGEKVFLDKAAKIRNFGAAVVVMLFDEQGQAVTYEQKISVAERAYRLLTENGFPAWDIVFDPNILSIATGIEEHDSYGKAYIDAVAWIKANLPHAKISGGVSNLSFAFRGNNAVREAMHSVFLYHAIKAGMDMGIVNAGMLQVYDQIEPTLLKKCEDAILYRSKDAADELISYAQTLVGTASATQSGTGLEWREGSLEERMKYALQRGLDTYITEDTLEGYEKLGDPAKVIDTLLMPAMDHVGQLFGEGKMFLPQVVKSARVMKKSIAALTPYMTSEDKGSSSGTVVIATVKGDVHDIGKNIVAVVMACNGYEVVDLGVMVEPERIIDEAIRTNAICIALSGLITPSLEEMRKVCEMAEKRGLRIPVIIGGATTSEMHTAVKIAPSYSGVVIRGTNASQNVQVLAKLQGPDREKYIAEVKESQAALRAEFETRKNTRLIDLGKVREDRPRKASPSTPAWEGIRNFEGMTLKELVPLINWKFFTASWGAKGDTTELMADAHRMLDRICSEKLLTVQGLAGLFRARSCVDDIIISDSEGKEWKFPMLRNQTAGEKNLCLSDFITEDGSDYAGVCSITVGIGLRKLTEQFRAEGDDYSAIMVKLLADRLTEAFAEYLRLKTGCTIFAFGYASCPDHSLKQTAFELLGTESRTGMRLTENYMIDPGESICGLLVPDTDYFSVGKISQEQLEDYSTRRGLPEEKLRTIIPNNLLK